MDAKEKRFIETLKILPGREQAKVLDLIMFFHWRRHGGRKTAQTKRGEKVYQELQREKQLA